MLHVFIVGSKGVPANYGGYETFVEKLIENQVSMEIKYHVACAVDSSSDIGEFIHHGAHCFKILRRPIGSAKAIFYDTDALKWCVRYIEENGIANPIVYILTCRIGPFMKKIVRKVHAFGGTVFVNPDGHEWKRAKWSAPVRKYWKISEAAMVRHADLLICDSRSIEMYIMREYAKYQPKTMFIAYGADLAKSNLPDDSIEFTSWLDQYGLIPDGYYLVVGRFVPENNYETMIREFMASDSKRDLVLVTNAHGAFLNRLKALTHFEMDQRIKFVGTIYKSEVLKKVRENAHAYLHGHEIGGTNPSLLEALSYTKLNLLYDVCFNSEVAGGAALYWTKQAGSLCAQILVADQLASDKISVFGVASTEVIARRYSWSKIIEKYENLFLHFRR